MTDQLCCLEAQTTVRLNWKSQFRLRSSLLKLPDGLTLVGTEVCRNCGALWFYDGRAPQGAAEPVYWYVPVTPDVIDRCDEVERTLDTHADARDATGQRALDALVAEVRAARGSRPWLRLVDQGPGAEWAAIGSWQPLP